MDFELQWLLLGLPLAFALGWLASRFDLRQVKREQRETPQAYFKGLVLLLNEQQDKAIDAFIEAVQQDPNSTDLHFALGNLFRRRGEYERAVRVHEHLLQRADLPLALRERAQDALAQDFMKAGLFDRAEQAYRSLEGSRFDTDARLALISLYERSRDWRAAIEVARKLERSGTASFASRIAHYWCEIAEEADARHQASAAAEALRQAQARRAEGGTAPGARRAAPGADGRAQRGDAGLLRTLASPIRLRSSWWRSTMPPARISCGQQAIAREQLETHYRRNASTELLAAIALLDADPTRQRSAAARPSARTADAVGGAAAALPGRHRRRGAGRCRCAVAERRHRACRAAAASLSLRRLRLRRAALFLAVPRLHGLGQLPAATPGGPVMGAHPTA